ncbi:hypothetical protein E2562_009733 [Oryza meyeriana var. granulata]|uniref:Uncharacterized protein n=1 Tax=Oryza meyeriana var. granulata TaxID=110450 RepID=A0A6G1D101_9ORYZ|nr:hypothetical protein E2562_009733 [Oryza meyeriana var. granulata]
MQSQPFHQRQKSMDPCDFWAEPAVRQEPAKQPIGYRHTSLGCATHVVVDTALGGCTCSLASDDLMEREQSVGEARKQ